MVKEEMSSLPASSLDTHIHSPALSLIPALWLPFRNLIQLTKLTISVLSIETEKEESILGAQSHDHGRQGYAF